MLKLLVVKPGRFVEDDTHGDEYLDVEFAVWILVDRFEPV